jgi:hypothetical protein
MLRQIRNVAVGTAIKAKGAYNDGMCLFWTAHLCFGQLICVFFVAHKACFEAHREMLASVIVYKAKKEEVKDRKKVQVEYRQEKYFIQQKVRELGKAHREHQGTVHKTSRFYPIILMFSLHCS